jgi:hypothetical protein
MVVPPELPVGEKQGRSRACDRGRCWDSGVDEEVSRLLESGASGMVEETGAGGGDRGQAGGSGGRGIRGRAGGIRRPAVCAAGVHG